MKYLKLFEEIQFSTDLRILMGRWLNKIKPENYSINYSYYKRGDKMPFVALNGSVSNRRTNYPVFAIGVIGVSDKKQRGNPEILKLKVRLDYCYNYSNVNNIDFVDNIKLFLIDIFKRYSYFDKKKNDYYHKNMQTYDYYILTEDIPKIMKDLEDEFEIYCDTKKYNL